jgi:hypothetical protein
MARRLMFVQLKSGHDTDRGRSWIGWADFNRSWKTARFHGRELRRFQEPDANFTTLTQTNGSGCPDRSAIGATLETAQTCPRSTTTHAPRTRHS